MSFVGFVIFIIFALAFQDIAEAIGNYVDKGEAANTSALCQTELAAGNYSVDILGAYDNWVNSNLASGSNLGSANCKIKGSAGTVTLTRRDKQGATNTYTLQSESSGKTTWFDCP